MEKEQMIDGETGSLNDGGTGRIGEVEDGGGKVLWKREEKMGWVGG